VRIGEQWSFEVNMHVFLEVEDLRHLRRMLEGTVRKLSAAEVDGLIGSLSPRR